jgi:hypothetical protein
VNATRAERLKVMGGDRHVVSLVGLHVLGDLADRLGLTAAVPLGSVPASLALDLTVLDPV